MADPRKPMQDIEFNGQDLWREEVYTDRAVGSIRVLVPVTAAGEPDWTRKREFYAQTQVMTGAGPLPVEGPIAAETLAEERAAHIEDLRRMLPAPEAGQRKRWWPW